MTLCRERRTFATKMTGAQIRAAREARGWTQLQLAQAIGVAFETVCRWEQGRLGLRRTSEVAVRSVLEGEDREEPKPIERKRRKS